jgi:hypothetical protein
LAAAAIFAGASAFAAPVSASFLAEFDLPDTSTGVRVFEVFAQPTLNAPNLDASNEIASPEYWSGHATVDLDASGLITLSGDGGDESADDYDLLIFVISNILVSADAFITGVATLVTSSCRLPAAPRLRTSASRQTA